MSDDPTVPIEQAELFGRSRWPWAVAVAGLVCIAAAAVVTLAVDGLRPRPGNFSSETDAPALARLALTLGGALAVGLAVSRRPNRVPMLLLAFVAALLARRGFHPAWDSGRMLAGGCAIVAGIAAGLMALPQRPRRVGVSLLILFHFGGILIAVTHPPGGQRLWVNQVVMTYVYRPYLDFVYLHESYQYFAPEPGPSHQFWFCIYGADGGSRWYKLPQLQKDLADPLALSYQRRRTIAQRAAIQISWSEIRNEDLSRRESMAGVVPWHPDLSHEEQWRAPSDDVRSFIIPSFVRYVARAEGLRHDAIAPIKSVKVYRVEHRILEPQEVKTIGFDDPTTYRPFFWGDYDPNGKQINMGDPLLYWMVPIAYQPVRNGIPHDHTPQTHPREFKLIDGVTIHARRDHEQ